MTVPPLRVVGDEPPADPEPSGEFFLIVADHDRNAAADVMRDNARAVDFRCELTQVFH